MIKRLKSITCYSIFWICFFIIARVFFLIVQFKETLMCKPVEILGTFWHGFQMDVSVTGYLLLIPLLLSVPGTFFNGRWYKVFMKFYTYLLIILFTIIIVVDAELYTYWGFRMDSSLLDYLKTPKDAMASIDTRLVLYFVISFLLFAGLSIYLFKKLIYSTFSKFESVAGRSLILPSFFSIANTAWEVTPRRLANEFWESPSFVRSLRTPFDDIRTFSAVSGPACGICF